VENAWEIVFFKREKKHERRKEERSKQERGKEVHRQGKEKRELQRKNNLSGRERGETLEVKILWDIQATVIQPEAVQKDLQK